MRVLELAQIMAGPTCGLMLADLGADVVKVEKLQGGDDSRGYREPRVNGVSAPFLMMNRNKRGIALDLKAAQGREILLRLVRNADVLIENYRRGTMDKLGLSYDVLAAQNPALIYCAITGYRPRRTVRRQGRLRPRRARFRRAHGDYRRARAPAGEERQSGVGHQRRRARRARHRSRPMRIVCSTGRGQLVDTSLFEAALQQTYWHAASYFATGQSPEPLGSAHLLTAPYQAFEARDGYLNIGGANQANWERIADVLGHPEWRTDARFATNTARMENRDALVDAMNAVLRTRTRAEWMIDFDAAGVPAGPVHSLGEALEHAQTRARGMVVDLAHPEAGATRALGCPIHFSDTPPRIDRAAPLLGEHTREVLREAGYEPAQIEAFVAAGVVAAHDAFDVVGTAAKMCRSLATDPMELVMTLVRALVRFAVPVGFAALLSGCLIGFGSGTVTNSGGTATYRVNFTATLTTCTPTPLPPAGSTVSCRFQLATGQSWTVTVHLPGIAPSSLPPLFDPLILQIPHKRGNLLRNRYRSRGRIAVGDSGDRVRCIADATTPIVVEPGHQLVLIDLQPGASLVSGATYRVPARLLDAEPAAVVVDGEAALRRKGDHRGRGSAG